MVRLGLAVVALAAALIAFGSTGTSVAAQPQPQTEIKLFTPWLPNGMLNPAVTIRSREAFMGNPNLPSDCQSGAITTQRPDAWRCVTGDPCFAPTPYSAREVACSTEPWANEVVVLMLSRPLPGPDECRASPNICPRELDLDTPPWALELANGARCRQFTGTIVSIGGLAMLYACDNGGMVGVADREEPFDKSQPLWRAFYLPANGTVVTQVGVLVAWH